MKILQSAKLCTQIYLCVCWQQKYPLFIPISIENKLITNNKTEYYLVRSGSGHNFFMCCAFNNLLETPSRMNGRTHWNRRILCYRMIDRNPQIKPSFLFSSFCRKARGNLDQESWWLWHHDRSLFPAWENNFLPSTISRTALGFISFPTNWFSTGTHLRRGWDSVELLASLHSHISPVPVWEIWIVPLTLCPHFSSPKLLHDFDYILSYSSAF
jgi:hypothetical protein